MRILSYILLLEMADLPVSGLIAAFHFKLIFLYLPDMEILSAFSRDAQSLS